MNPQNVACWLPNILEMIKQVRYGETRHGGLKKKHKIDFGVPGLSNSVVKEAERIRVQELVKKIESHPHREALEADLQQIEGDDPRIG